MLYQLSKAKKSYGANSIFEDINFLVKNTEKIALVGRNGCGKTTFLRCITGEESFDQANINKKNGITIGYLSQKVFLQDEIKVKDELYNCLLYTSPSPRD